MDQAALEPFPLTRYIHFHSFRFYYPFGNTLADDFLQSVQNKSSPNILSLGCGDIRSCFYTLWKHFGPNNNSGYTGVHFVLNDCSASVLARNILFLSLCLKMPKSSKKIKEWIASFWAIWYNHELKPKHRETMIGALRLLLEWSENERKWSECELGSLVKFTSNVTLQTIRKVWQEWGVSALPVEHMKKLRSDFQKRYFQGCTLTHAFHYIASESIIKPIIHDVPPEQKDSMVVDFVTYLEAGNAFAEPVLNLSVPARQTTVNMTLFDRTDGSYTLHYLLAPYLAYTAIPLYSPSFVTHTTEKKESDQLLVSDDTHFVQTPLLANSVQQFSMWVVAASKIIIQSKQPGSTNLSFTFDCGDAIAFCQNYHEKVSDAHSVVTHFDAIYTSNLADHLSPPALILMCASILEPTGVLFTTTLRFKDIGSTKDGYLTSFFGFQPELFPVLLGIRCIGHEGQYSSKVASQPIPPGNTHKGVSLVWQKVTTEPLKIASLADCSVLCNALCSSAISACTCPLQTKRIALLDHLSAEAFLIILHCFISQLHPQVPASSCTFWEPLCKMITGRREMKSHLLQLQTQSLLHGLHLHLTLSEDECPICRAQPLQDYIDHCCISIATASLRPEVNLTPLFVIDVQVASTLAHITSFAGCMMGPELKLHFFLPKAYAHCKVKVRIPEGGILKPSKVKHGNLCIISWDAPRYLFLSTHSQHSVSDVSSSLGQISKHMGDASSFETVIAMSDASAASISQLKVHHVAVAELQIDRGEGLQLTIQYPYPIDYSGVHIKISKRNNTITITACRASSRFYDETCTFLVDPNNRLALPPATVFSLNTVKLYSLLQLEEDPLKSMASFYVKRIISLLLEGCMFAPIRCKPIILVHPNPYHSVIIIVHEVLHDIQFQTPALDLSYCFLDVNPEGRLQVKSVEDCCKIYIDIPVLDLLKKVFPYFTSQGRNSTCASQPKVEINEAFKRAVVYPLYPDPDVAMEKASMASILPIALFSSLAAHTPSTDTGASTRAPDKQKTKESSVHQTPTADVVTISPKGTICCSYCNKPSENTLKKCARCLSVQYCGNECQSEHWKTHKTVCKKHDSSPISGETAMEPFEPPRETLTDDKGESTKVIRCSRCGKVRGSLKKCTRCLGVQYCGNECQSEHWKTHKIVCKKHDSSPIGGETATEPFEPPRETLTDDKGESTGEIRCSRCGKVRGSLKKCTQCLGVQYCGKECQTEHRKTHKTVCKKHDSSPISGETATEPFEPLRETLTDDKGESTNVIRCSRCGKVRGSLKKCTQCLGVQYCGKECQSEHWKTHKTVCKKHDSSPIGGETATEPFEPPRETLTDDKGESTKVLHCSRCGKVGDSLKECTRCLGVQYCGKECQTEHWKTHKTVCKKHDSSPISGETATEPFEPLRETLTDDKGESTNVIRCSRCGKVRGSLKKCTQCLGVQYCGKECQSEHWKTHKTVCKKHDSSPIGGETATEPFEPPRETLTDDKGESTKVLHCSRCGKVGDSLKECTRCLGVQYCGKECQTEHWKTHKTVCKKHDSSPISGETATEPFEPPRETLTDDKGESTKVIRCSRCGKVRGSLKKCTQCLGVQYCGKACQSEHWKTHKTVCKKHDSSPIGGETATEPFEPPRENLTDDKGESTKVLHCSRYGKVRDSLKKCARCLGVQYCGKECQSEHWKTLETVCMKHDSSLPGGEMATEPSSEPPKQTLTHDKGASTKALHCSRCGKGRDSLKKCPCHKASYCSVECQRLDWRRHQTEHKA